jgi:hypothetical protein
MNTTPMRDVRRQLADKFGPIVLSFVLPIVDAFNASRRASVYYKPTDDVSLSVEVKYVGQLGAADEMFNATVRLHGGEIYIEELKELAGELANEFGAYENEDDTLLIDNLTYSLGDGDDTHAVTFKDGEFKIWLRGFDL